ncbi:MAG: enoyl-CoA hydratase, partial [Candidatus Neomarinimicrobiota bacterium]
GAEMYSIEASVDAGLMDQAVEQEKLMEVAIHKAEDLATMGHPSYSLTKELFINDVAAKINNALDEIDVTT